MKRILLLCTLAETGGTQMSVYNLARELTALGHMVTVGFGPGTFLKDALSAINIKTVQFQHLKRSYNIGTNTRFVLELSRYLTQHPQDVLHCNSSNTLFGAVAAKIQKKKPLTVFTFRGLSLLDIHYPGSPIKKWLYRTIFNILLLSIDKKVCVSQENFDQLKRYGMTKHTSVVYNGLDATHLTFLEQKEARAVLGEKIGTPLSEKIIIGSIGRLSYQKNYEFLITEWPAITTLFPNAMCIIIGEGPEKSKYEALIKALHIEKECLLVGSIEKAQRYLKAFDLFVMPSRYEGLSIVLIEALFANVPILASDVNSNAEVVETAGKTFPLDDARAFLKQLACFST
ncbi:MAG: hypothetical protein COU33_00860, partial [Candidatus Magasanikbacteria bacterium CG10_big_fil_rev_8_21_14_0_10_43_6]